MQRGAVQVTGIDHIVLRVKDPVASVAWYASKLGLEPVRLEEYSKGEVPFPSVRISPTFLIDFMKAKQTQASALNAPDASGSTGTSVDHFCVVVAGDEIEAVRQQLAEAGVPAEQQFDGLVVRRFGAQGNASSIYVRDPDGNVVELRTYGAAAQ